MNGKQICGAIVALCVAAVAARADSLELKNGSLIKGKFMGGTQTSITFQVGSSVQSYDVADVRSLRFDSEAQGASPSIPSKQPSVPSSIEQEEVATICSGHHSSRYADFGSHHRFHRLHEESRGISFSGFARRTSVGRRQYGGSEGRRCLWPVGRVERDRNFHWKVCNLDSS